MEVYTMKQIKQYLPGILLTAILAITANQIASVIPGHLISGSVFALLLGMLLNPAAVRLSLLSPGIKLVSKQVLRLAIILMGLTLSFSQVLEVGRYSLFVMFFTLISAFGGGYLLGRLFHMNWKLSSLISAGTGICGGSAIAAIAPTIHAKDSDIAYAISATFLFDIVMVILFPIAGQYFRMSDMGFGLWAGTAVNDTSSVVAAGYAFSDAAGAYSVIVKLTRTLSIVPIVLIFSLVSARAERLSRDHRSRNAEKVNIGKIFPFFILLFLVMVAVKSSGIISDTASSTVSVISKFCMVMALGAIGLKTNFREMARSGAAPMLHGFLISALVVLVSFLAQVGLGQI